MQEVLVACFKIDRARMREDLEFRVQLLSDFAMFDDVLRQRIANFISQNVLKLERESKLFKVARRDIQSYQGESGSLSDSHV
mmetsp:Transcript_5370/g.9019  ORF Transcript_5370/g.9019 Transcript_5370/m.9019 type:complete len:82 (+) Transcript_5370:658-903(+)